MATDGPTPQACDRDIFENGKIVTVTHSIPSNRMEQWVREISKVSGQRVDWHFVGGRALVKTLGDLASVMRAIQANPPPVGGMED